MPENSELDMEMTFTSEAKYFHKESIKLPPEVIAGGSPAVCHYLTSADSGYEFPLDLGDHLASTATVVAVQVKRWNPNVLGGVEWVDLPPMVEDPASVVADEPIAAVCDLCGAPAHDACHVTCPGPGEVIPCDAETLERVVGPLHAQAWQMTICAFQALKRVSSPAHAQLTEALIAEALHMYSALVHTPDGSVPVADAFEAVANARANKECADRELVGALEALVRFRTRQTWPGAAWVIVDVSAWRECPDDSVEVVAVLSGDGSPLHPFHAEPTEWGFEVRDWATQLADLGETGSWTAVDDEDQSGLKAVPLDGASSGPFPGCVDPRY